MLMFPYARFLLDFGRKHSPRFSVESYYTSHPVGVHGTSAGFHSLAVADKITRAILY